MQDHCPICGRSLTLMETILSEHDAAYQCRHCWNRIQATGSVKPPVAVRLPKKQRFAGARRHLTRA